MDAYIDSIYQQYIKTVPDKVNRNIAIIDGENLTGYYKLTDYSIACGNSIYYPILNLLTKSNVIDKNSLVFIIQKKDIRCANLELQKAKLFMNNVYILSIGEEDVFVNIDNQTLNLKVIKDQYPIVYNDQRNHFIKGFDDFIGNYILSYLYKISQGNVNSISFFSGDNFEDAFAYIRAMDFYTDEPVISAFKGFYSIGVYTASDQGKYLLFNSEQVNNTLVDANKYYTKEIMPSSTVCNFFESDNTIRPCKSRPKVNLKIHILGQSDRKKIMMDGLTKLIKPSAVITSLPPLQPIQTNQPKPVQWEPVKFTKPQQGGHINYYEKYLKYKSKYTALANHNNI